MKPLVIVGEARKWKDLIAFERLAEIQRLKDRGLILKEIAASMEIDRGLLSTFARRHNIVFDRGARVGNKNAEVHGEGHNTIKRLTKRIMLAAGRDITTCERCKWHHPFNESLARHHKDRNRNNNDLSNLEVLCQSCHTKEHNNDRARNSEGQFTAADDSRGSLGGI